MAAVVLLRSDAEAFDGRALSVPAVALTSDNDSIDPSCMLTACAAWAIRVTETFQCWEIRLRLQHRCHGVAHVVPDAAPAPVRSTSVLCQQSQRRRYSRAKKRPTSIRWEEACHRPPLDGVTAAPPSTGVNIMPSPDGGVVSGDLEIF
jgi:hypothetical protein